MIDPTKGIGLTPGIASGTRVQDTITKRVREGDEVSSPKDEVVVSKEAISAQDAEKASARVRQQLASSDYTLGLKPGFDENV